MIILINWRLSGWLKKKNCTVIHAISFKLALSVRIFYPFCLLLPLFPHLTWLLASVHPVIPPVPSFLCKSCLYVSFMAYYGQFFRFTSICVHGHMDIHILNTSIHTHKQRICVHLYMFSIHTKQVVNKARWEEQGKAQLSQISFWSAAFSEEAGICIIGIIMCSPAYAFPVFFALPQAPRLILIHMQRRNCVLEDF